METYLLQVSEILNPQILAFFLIVKSETKIII